MSSGASCHTLHGITPNDDLTIKVSAIDEYEPAGQTVCEQL
jgi:hypothetical protein